MLRIIKILEYFKNNQISLSLTFLSTKLSVTVRTVQAEIKVINNLLSNFSNCKIVSVRKNLFIIGDNKKEAISKLWNDFCKTNLNSISTEINSIILEQIGIYTPFTHKKSFLSAHKLKDEINKFNNFFCFNKLDINIKKIRNKWNLVGKEIYIRFLIINIIVTQINPPLYPNNMFDPNLNFLYESISKKLIINKIYGYEHNVLVWFIIVFLKRVKKLYLINNNNFSSYKNFLTLKIISDHKSIISILEQELGKKIPPLDHDYVFLMLLITKNVDSSIIKFANVKESITEINNQINNIFKIPLKNIEVNKFIIDFFCNYWFKLVFYFLHIKNYKKMFSFWNVPIINFWGWKFIKIIENNLKSQKIVFNYSLILNEDLQLRINNLKLKRRSINWVVSLYYPNNKKNNKVNFQSAKLQLNNLSNYIKIKSLKFNNITYQLNFINKNKVILVCDSFKNSFYIYKNIYPINFDGENEKDLLVKTNKLIKIIMIEKVSENILILNFFHNTSFISIKSLLWTCTSLIARKYKINYIALDLENAYLNFKYIDNYILIVQQLLSDDCLELPIILFYINTPIIYESKYKINFIFIIANNAKNFYEEEWLQTFFKNFTKYSINKIDTVNELYELINNAQKT